MRLSEDSAVCDSPKQAWSTNGFACENGAADVEQDIMMLRNGNMTVNVIQKWAKITLE